MAPLCSDSARDHASANERQGSLENRLESNEKLTKEHIASEPTCQTSDDEPQTSDAEPMICDDDARKVFCPNLPMDIEDWELQTLFGTYGKVMNTKIIDGEPPGVSMCAFITYETEDFAKAAIQRIHAENPYDVYKIRRFEVWRKESGRGVDGGDCLSTSRPSQPREEDLGR